jgi:hypothetical protein
MAHGRSYSNGHLQWCTFELRIGRICHGEPVCDRCHRCLYRTPADACILVVLGSCHFGNIIEYDTVSNLSWSVDVRTHAIAQLVDRVLSEPWAAANKLGLEVPPSKRQDDCVVSFRVPSHKVELFSHGRGAAAGLLQMGLWKLQLMISNLFFRDAYTRLFQKHHYVVRSETIGRFRKDGMFVMDEMRLRDVFTTPWKCPSFVKIQSRVKEYRCQLDANLTD